MRNLADVAAYALDEAQFTGRDYGLLLQRDVIAGEVVYRYEWRERTGQGWRRPPVAGCVCQPGAAAGMNCYWNWRDSPFTESELAAGAEETPAPQVVLRQR